MKGLGLSVIPLTAGVRTDMQNFLEKFVSTNSVRYTVFSECFREMNFVDIFKGRTSQAEFREFSEKMLMIAIEFCDKSYVFQTRVGGLYLLYALYFLQPEDLRMKIRITCAQWEELTNFVEQLKLEQHFDAVFCFFKLVRAFAFHIVALLDDRNPLYQRKFESHEDSQHIGETLRKEAGNMSALLNEECVNEIAEIHDQYWESKCRVSMTETGEPEPALQLVRSDQNPYSMIHDILKNAEEAVRKQGRLPKFDAEEGEKTSHGASDDDAETSAKGARANVRDKAYKQVPKQARHRRHRQQSGAENSIDRQQSGAGAGTETSIEFIIQNVAHDFHAPDISGALAGAVSSDSESPVKRGRNSKNPHQPARPLKRSLEGKKRGPKPKEKPILNEGEAEEGGESGGRDGGEKGRKGRKEAEKGGGDRRARKQAEKEGRGGEEAEEEEEGGIVRKRAKPVKLSAGRKNRKFSAIDAISGETGAGILLDGPIAGPSSLSFDEALARAEARFMAMAAESAASAAKRLPKSDGMKKKVGVNVGRKKKTKNQGEEENENFTDNAE